MYVGYSMSCTVCTYMYGSAPLRTHLDVTALRHFKQVRRACMSSDPTPMALSQTRFYDEMVWCGLGWSSVVQCSVV